MAAFANARGLPFRRNVLSSAFSPSGLFASGEQGAWLDPSDLSSMWQDSAGTTPAVVDSPVGKINDKSGRGNHFTQATTAKKPILRLASGKYYLEFDGVDDALASAAAINFSATDKMFLCSGQRADSTASATIILELTGNASSTAGGFASYVATNGQHVAEGLTFNDYYYAITAPNLAVMTVTADRSVAGASELTARENTVAKTLSASTAGDASGNYANDVLYLGARAGTSLYFPGRIYQLILRGAATNSTDRDNTEAFVNTKTGAY